MKWVKCLLSGLMLCGTAASQPAPSSDPQEGKGKTVPGPGQPPEDKRLFGVLPNYRTAESSVPFRPITTRQKFTIAVRDSFDYPVFLTTGFFAGISQLQASDNYVYGQGMKGFAHRYGISYLDQISGNFFPEAIVPTLFHKDPRYFRKGQGSKKSRLGYAVSRIVVSRSDSGAANFNSPEIIGNALASLTDLSFHPHERTIGAALSKWGLTYVSADTIGQILKEFWPDIKRKLFQKRERVEK